jgi:hypothetical protein
VQKVDKEHSKGPCSSTDNESVETVLQILTQALRSVYGTLLIRLVSVKSVLVIIYGVRRWIGQRGVWSIKHQSSDLTSLEFCRGGGVI